MYNMGTASRNGLKHALTLEQRKQIMAEAAEQRMLNSWVEKQNTQVVQCTN